MKHILQRIGGLLVAILVLPASATASDWSWSLTPYAWASDVTADVELNDREVVGGEVDFSDLIDDADFALMGHLEGRRGRHGVFGDLLVADFGDEPRVFRPILRTIEAKSDLEMTILEGGGVYYPGGTEGRFGLRYGVRVLDVDQEIDVVLVGGLPTDRRIVDAGATFVDAMIGARYDTTFADSWSFAAWGDVAGGDSDGSWSAALVVGYHYGPRDQYALRFGYRHLAIELENDDRNAEVESEITMSGPMVGLSFTF